MVIVLSFLFSKTGEVSPQLYLAVIFGQKINRDCTQLFRISMPSDSSKLSVIASRIRGVARVWSALIWLLALILMVGTRNAPSTSSLVNAPLEMLIPISLLISLIGLGIAWRWEGWGVLINFGFYLAILPLYWMLHREWIHISIMVGLSPVVLPGVLFGVAWLLSKKNNPDP